MSWIAVAIGGGALVGGAASVYSTNKSSGSQIQTKQINRWSPEQQEMYKKMMGRMQEGGYGRTPTAQENQYGNFLENYPQWSKSAVNEAFNPEYVKKMYRESIIPEFEQEYLPQVKEAYAGPGYWGSARAQGVANAYGDLAGQEAKDVGGVEGQRQQALYQMLQQQPQMEQMGAQWSRYLQDLGEDWTSPKWQAALQMLALDPYYMVGGATTPQPTFGSSLAGGLGQGLGSYLGNMFGNRTQTGGTASGYSGTAGGALSNGSWNLGGNNVVGGY